jgi:hypothetical protein
MRWNRQIVQALVLLNAADIPSYQRTFCPLIDALMPLTSTLLYKQVVRIATRRAKAVTMNRPSKRWMRWCLDHSRTTAKSSKDGKLDSTSEPIT